MEVRVATVQDIETLVKFRLEMFREMGKLEAGAQEHELAAALREYFSAAIPSRRFFAWLAIENGAAIGSSGLILLCKPPSPENLAGTEGYVMSMYTLPGYRGRGVATSLLKECARFARSAGAGRLSLHASRFGKPVYERFGLAECSGEMRMTLGRERNDGRGACPRPDSGEDRGDGIRPNT